MKTYAEVRPLMRVGDVMAFGGHGFISGGIKLFTRSPVSHIGTILRMTEGRVWLIESTTLSGRKGVQVNPLSERVAEYDGDVWWLPLSDAIRARVDWQRFTVFLADYEQRAIPYDYRQCLRMAIAPLAHVPGLGFLRNHEDLSKVYCSELVSAALEYSGGLPFGTDCSDVAPADLCSMALYRECCQIKGKPKDLPHFNTRPMWAEAATA